MAKRWLSACMLWLVWAAIAEARDEKLIIVGYVENISIPAVELTLKAKLDTGATTSSIHANIIEMPQEKKKESAETPEKLSNKDQQSDDAEESDDTRYVTFSIVNSDKETKHLKKEITRFVRIKMKDGNFIRRPVVRMTFCIAGQLVEEEVNLSNRDHYNYDVLIGRNMLTKGNLIIDAAKTFTTRPNCPKPENQASLLDE